MQQVSVGYLEFHYYFSW